MCDRHFLLKMFFVALVLSYVPVVTAQPMAPVTVCKPADFWADCVKKVKAAINQTKDPAVALSAAAEWADRYTRLYKANSRDTWTPNDQEMLEQAMTKLWDETVGQYLDPASLALGLALAKYFPRLAATLELASAPQLIFFVALIAPSPVANDFTAAGPDNAEINRLVMARLPFTGSMTIKQRYPELFDKGYETVKGKKIKLP